MKNDNLIWTKQQWFAVAFDFYVKAVKSRKTPFTFDEIRAKWDGKGYPQPTHANGWGTVARDNYACQYCGEYAKKLECDHVIPVAHGGGHSLENLKTACFKCNRSKRDKLIEEWMSI